MHLRLRTGTSGCVARVNPPTNHKVNLSPNLLPYKGGRRAARLPSVQRCEESYRPSALWVGSAHLAGVQMRRFHSSILGRGRKGLLPSLRKGLLPLWGRDGQVKCSRAPRQGGQEDVCRPSCFIRSLWQQEAGFLNLCLEAGAVGPGSQKVAQRVVPLSALPTSSTGACM